MEASENRKKSHAWPQTVQYTWLIMTPGSWLNSALVYFAFVDVIAVFATDPAVCPLVTRTKGENLMLFIGKSRSHVEGSCFTCFTRRIPIQRTDTTAQECLGSTRTLWTLPLCLLRHSLCICSRKPTHGQWTARGYCHFMMQELVGEVAYSVLVLSH